MTARWYDSIDAVGAERILPLQGSPVDFGYGLLRAVETTLWGDLRVRYLCLEDGERLCAFVPIYYGTNVAFMALLPALMQRGYAWLVRQAGHRAAYRVLVAGSLMSDRGFIPLHPDADAHAVVREMLKAIDAFAATFRAHIAFVKDIHGSFPGIDAFRASDFVECYTLPTVAVRTDFTSPEAYIARLSANGRSNVRRILKRAQRFKFRFVSDYEPLIPRVYPLWRATYLKARFKLEELPPRFFVECARSSPPASELLVCERDGAIVGAYLTFYAGGQQLNKRIGMDYTDPDCPVIYNALNIHCLLRAAERGVPLSYLGQTTYTPKLRLGGQLEDQFLFIKAYRVSVKLGLPLQKLWNRRYRAQMVEHNERPSLNQSP